MSGDYQLFCATCDKRIGVEDYHLRTLLAAIDLADVFVDLAETFAELPEDTGFDLISPWHHQSGINLAAFRGHKGHTLLVHDDGENPVDVSYERARMAEERQAALEPPCPPDAGDAG